MILLDLELAIHEFYTTESGLPLPGSVQTINPNNLLISPSIESSIFQLLVLHKRQLPSLNFFYVKYKSYEVFKYCPYNTDVYIPTDSSDPNKQDIFNFYDEDIQFLTDLNDGIIETDDVLELIRDDYNSLVTKGLPNSPLTYGLGEGYEPNQDFIKAYKDWTYIPSTKLGKIIRFFKSVRRLQFSSYFNYQLA